jgi:DNA repair protein RadC
MSHINAVRGDLAYYNVTDIDTYSLLSVVCFINKDDPVLLKRLSDIGVRKLSEFTLADLQEIGVSHAVACRLVACFGLAKKLATSRMEEKMIIRSPQDVFNLTSERMRYLRHEEFIILLLDTKNGVIGQEMISKGSLNATVVHPREVFVAAIKRSGCSIICVHNHPSGDPTPSPEDIRLTERLVETGNVIGIEILDHIVIGDGRYISLKEQGLI